jgi:hypothetical protein
MYHTPQFAQHVSHTISLTCLNIQHPLINKRLLIMLDVVPRESFLIDARSLKIAAYNMTGLSTNQRPESKDADGKVTTNAAGLLRLTGKGWQLISRDPSVSKYPQYWKAIPDQSKVSALGQCLNQRGERVSRKIKAIHEPKSEADSFDSRRRDCKNDGISFFRKTAFARDILTLGVDHVIGVNVEILQIMLRFIIDDRHGVCDRRESDVQCCGASR